MYLIWQLLIHKCIYNHIYVLGIHLCLAITLHSMFKRYMDRCVEAEVKHGYGVKFKRQTQHIVKTPSYTFLTQPPSSPLER